MNKRELAQLGLGLSVMALTVIVSLAVGRADTLVSRLDLYLDHHQLPGDCEKGQEEVRIYRSSFGPEDGYDRGWQVSGQNATWMIVSYGYDRYGWMAYGDAVSDQRLTSPPIYLPIHTSDIRLRFYDQQQIEHAKTGCYDGGVLEISLDRGATWSELPDSERIVDFYDGIVLPDLGNPLAGRWAWCSVRGYWLDGVVDLDEYAGQTVVLRFRLGTDSSVTSLWRIDNVRVLACQDENVRPGYLPLVLR